MKTWKIIRLVVAGALALGLNGLALAHSIDLNATSTPVTGSVASITSEPGSLFVASAPGGSVQALTGDVLQNTKPSNGNVIRAGFHKSFFHHHDLDDCPPVPEPGTYLMMLAGLSLLGFMYYRRQRGSMSARFSII